MEYTGDITLLLVGVVLGGLLIMGGLLYLAYWLFFKKAVPKEVPENEEME